MKSPEPNMVSVRTNTKEFFVKPELRYQADKATQISLEDFSLLSTDFTVQHENQNRMNTTHITNIQSSSRPHVAAQPKSFNSMNVKPHVIRNNCRSYGSHRKVENFLRRRTVILRVYNSVGKNCRYAINASVWDRLQNTV